MEEKKKVKKKTSEAAKKKAPRKKLAQIAQKEQVVAAEKIPIKVKKEKKERFPEAEVFYGTGRRKTATARVFIYKGTGTITVNSKPAQEYFCKRAILLSTIERPLIEVKARNEYNVDARVLGGGIPAQADAVRMGIARALVASNAQHRIVLRSLDLLKRDPREKERKKYGLKRARRAFQYSKR